jgi:serine/threonine-protein kinase
LILRQREPLGYKLVLKWFSQMLDAVEYLHNLPTPVFHRDLKPSNFKLSPQGKIKLLDFGIAKELDSSHFLAEKSLKLATLEFSPLEQAVKASSLIRDSLKAINREQTELLLKTKTSAATDIFALGATLYRLLTLTLPMDCHNRALSIWSDKPDPLLSIRSFDQAIPSDIEMAIMKSLSILPSQRPGSIKELRELMRYSIELSNESPMPSESLPSNNDFSQKIVRRRQDSQVFFKIYQRKYLERMKNNSPENPPAEIGENSSLELYLK